MPTNPQRPLSPEQDLARRTRRSFLALGAGAAGVAGGIYWLMNQPDADEIPRALRSVLGFNERVVRSALYSNSHLTATYPASAIGKLKKNGDIGMEGDLDADAWRLEVAGQRLTLADVRGLPRYEQIVDFKCVEGWSTVTQFAGARL